MEFFKQIDLLTVKTTQIQFIMYGLKYLKIVTLVFITLPVFAQDVNEAYNFSNNVVQGTARSIGFGNALGSVGGDFSSLSVNPAGLGIYRSSEMSITPSLKINGASSDYLGNATMENHVALNVSHFGFVFTNAPKGKRYDNRNWKTVSFAFGMNKTADFNHDYTYSGKNNTSSASQAFESDANLNAGNDSIPGTLAFLGAASGLLNFSNGKFSTVVPFNGGINQQKIAQTRGGINEYVLSLGGNYKEKLMLGITLGIPSVNYQYNSTYTESVSAGNTNNPDNFSSFTYGKSLNITGSGLNLKMGMIYKLTSNLRIGAAFHSPTYYNLSETFDPSIAATVNGTTYGVTSADYQIGSQFNYSLITPWKGILSATYMIGNIGFVTADYEYVDYQSMKYQFPTGTDGVTGNTFLQEENAINQQIKSEYKAASNLRLGAELKMNKVFMLRAGIGYYGNPYQSNEASVQRIDMSLGIGFHFNHFFTDFGLVHSEYQVTEAPYSIDYTGVVSGLQATIPTAKISMQLNNIAWTVGFKF